MQRVQTAFNRNGFFGFGASLGGLSVVAVLALAPMATPTYAACFGDLTGPVGIPDGAVGTEDLQAVISSWEHYQSAADLDGDISTPVGIRDLLLLLEAWGDCPSPCDQNPCVEECSYDVCDVSGPCYDEGACLEILCANDPCYSENCPDYCYECRAIGDEDDLEIICDVNGPCFDGSGNWESFCCAWDPCSWSECLLYCEFCGDYCDTESQCYDAIKCDDGW